MSYIESTLGPDEKLIATAKIHKWFLVQSILIMGLGLLIFPWTWGIIFYIGVYAFVGELVRQFTVELGVTNKKVVFKWGLINRSSVEQRLSKIDAVTIDQNLDGRMLNYGTITIQGTGFTATAIKGIADPLAFRRAIEQAEEAAE